MKNSSEVVLTRLALEVATAGLAALIGATVAYGSLENGIGWGDVGPEPGYFPFYVGLIIVIASGIVALQAILRRENREEAFLTQEQGRRILAFFGPILAFVVLAVLLGMYVALILYLASVMIVQGGYRPLKAILVSVTTAAAFFLIFEIWFKVPLLKGPLEALLNIH